MSQIIAQKDKEIQQLKEREESVQNELSVRAEKIKSHEKTITELRQQNKDQQRQLQDSEAKCERLEGEVNRVNAKRLHGNSRELSVTEVSSIQCSILNPISHACVYTHITHTHAHVCTHTHTHTHTHAGTHTYAHTQHIHAHTHTHTHTHTRTHIRMIATEPQTCFFKIYFSGFSAVTVMIINCWSLCRLLLILHNILQTNIQGESHLL